MTSYYDEPWRTLAGNHRLKADHPLFDWPQQLAGDCWEEAGMAVKKLPHLTLDHKLSRHVSGGALFMSRTRGCVPCHLCASHH